MTDNLGPVEDARTTDSVAEAHAARKGDEAVLEFARGVLSAMRQLRIDNHWAPKIEARFRGVS